MRALLPLVQYNSNLVKYDLLMAKQIQITSPEFYLISSIVVETIATSCLKKTLCNKLWFLPVYLGYGLSFYTFPKSLTKFSLSSAYTIWCAVGIILTTFIDTIVYKEIITWKKLFGIFIIIFGIVLTR